MTETTEEDAQEYDPANPTPPEQASPLRQTAPQSPYTRNQVLIGFVVLVIGLALTFGLGLALA